MGGKRSLANVALRVLARRFMHLDTPMLGGVIVARWLLLRTILMDVSAWLRGLGLERYTPAFRDNVLDRLVCVAILAT